MRETTSLGAAIAAGFAIDIWKEFNELRQINQEGRTKFQPGISEEERTRIFKKWSRAVEMCRGWLDASESGGDF